jgi:hypothetical protein
MYKQAATTDYLQSRGYTLVVMVYDGVNLVDQVTISNRQLTNSLLLEMTASNTEELGRARRFRVMDATSYVEGMNTLSLMVTVNGEKKQRLVFPRALSDNTYMRVSEFQVDFYKSVVFEFDLYGMSNRMLL